MKRLIIFLIILLMITAAKAIEIPQNVDANIPIGPFVDTNANYLPSLTIPYTNVKLTKYGGTSQAAKANTAGLAYLGQGVYNCPLTGATDVGTLGWLRIDVNDINGVPVWKGDISVVSSTYWNWKYGSTTLTVTEPNFTPTATPTIIVANQTTLKSSIDNNGLNINTINSNVNLKLSDVNTTLKNSIDNNGLNINTINTNVATLNTNVSIKLSDVNAVIAGNQTTIMNKTNLIPANPSTVTDACNVIGTVAANRTAFEANFINTNGKIDANGQQARDINTATQTAMALIPRDNNDHNTPTILANQAAIQRQISDVNVYLGNHNGSSIDYNSVQAACGLALAAFNFSGITITGDTNGIATAILNSTGVTAGGTWTLAKALKVQAAVMAGTWQDKPGSPGVVQILDADDRATVIAELTSSETSPYKLMDVK